MRRTRGLIDLAFDLVDETSRLVERTHEAVVGRWARRIAPAEPATRVAETVAGLQTAIAAGVFKSIRFISGVTRIAVNAVGDVVEAGLDRTDHSELLDLTTPISSKAAGSAGWCLDHLQSSLNGFWGHYLSRNGSHLGLGMNLRHHGKPLPVTPRALAAAFPDPTEKICVFVHSLAATEWLWSLRSEKHYGDSDVTFGSRLLADLGFTPIYVRYNTGRHVSENGRELAMLLTEILTAYPVPIEEIALVGHSMGGLVARSAVHFARENNEPWVERLRHITCLGSPHLGAPLEKAVSLITGALKSVDAAGTQVPAELLASRSPGVKDLRYGYTVDEEWTGKDPDQVFADARLDSRPIDGIRYHFLAATISRNAHSPLGELLGDSLVRVASASGEAPQSSRRIHFDSGAVLLGMTHFDLASHPAAYEKLRDLMAS